MNRIDMLAFKIYCHDSDYFNELIVSQYDNPVIINFTFDKVCIRYKPPNINFKKEKINLFKFTRNENLNYYLLPIGTLINHFIFCGLIFSICLKFKPKVLLVEHTYVAIFAGIMRKCNLCEKSVLIAPDWIANAKNKKRLLGRIHCNLIFPFLDFLACKLNDSVINYTAQIGEARNRFWGKKITKKEKIYLCPLRIAVSNTFIDTKGKNICFIGQMRKDSGLDLAIKALNKIRQHEDISITIIGPKTQHYEYFKQLSKQYNVERYVKFLGFVETDQFNKILSDCFCGINILTIKETYSYNTIPGKIMHYIQYMLPVIVTEGVGHFSSVIRDNELGLVIEPSESEFINAIYKIFQEQRQYRDNILGYVNSLSKIDMKELIEN